MYGPCIVDDDCMAGNVCMADMNSCLNGVIPCCMSGNEAPKEIPKAMEGSLTMPSNSNAPAMNVVPMLPSAGMPGGN